MWFKRDFLQNIESIRALPVKVLKGPRQVGKTSLLKRLAGYQIVYFDDASVRSFAQANPRLFFDQLKGPLILDEATLSPEIFLELKRRVDEQRRDKSLPVIDVWITGSNQTLLQKNIRESLAGRASYFDLNTLSIHEIGDRWNLGVFLFKGGWPELYISEELNSTRYLNDLISTFIEKDIVSAAGIEKKSAFSRSLQLVAGRIGQLFNASDIAKNVGVDLTTVQSWMELLAENGILRSLRPYYTNLNQRLIKSPKYYFEDVGLAVRMQGWTEVQPLLLSPAVGHLVENIALNEITRFFVNRGEPPQIYFVRSKDKVEIDLLIQLPNQRFVAAEVKVTPEDFSKKQFDLLASLSLNVVEYWVLSPDGGDFHFKNAKNVSFRQIWSALESLA